MNKRNIKWLLSATVLVLALVAVGFFWWQARERQSIALASLPHQPSLQGRPAELAVRIRACEQAIRAGSAATTTLAELSQLYHANGFYAEASQCYQGLLRIDPSNPRWPHRYANILAGYGQLDEAVALWRRAAGQAKDYTPVQIRLADSLLKLNQSAEAATLYTKVLQREPENPYALVGLARIDVEAGRWTTARDRLELAVARSDYNIGFDLLVTVCEQLGDTVRADAIRSRYKAAGTFFDVPDVWTRELYFDCYDCYQLSVVGGVASREGDLSTALSLLERAVTIEPNNGYYHGQLAGLYQQAGNTASARQHLETAVKVTPDYADAWLNLARLLATSSQAQDVEITLANGLSHCPDSPSLHLMLGQRRVDAGRYDEAMQEFKKSAVLRPDEGVAAFELARLYFRLHRDAEALVELKNSLIAEPGFPPAMTALAFYYISNGDETAARNGMQKIKDQPRIQAQDRVDLEHAFQQRFGHAP